MDKTEETSSTKMDVCSEEVDREGPVTEATSDNRSNNKSKNNLTLYTLLIKLRNILTQSSVTAVARDDSSTNESAPCRERDNSSTSKNALPSAGDGVFYVDRILKTYFHATNHNEQQDEVGCNEPCSSKSLESPMKKKQER